MILGTALSMVFGIAVGHIVLGLIFGVRPVFGGAVARRRSRAITGRRY